MKKKFAILITVLISTLLFQTGCSNEDQTNSPDWEHLIRTDFFAGDSAIEQAMAEVVSIKIKQDGEYLTVTVKAPDICDELLLWMESVSDEEFSEGAMEEEILRLLKTSDTIEVDFAMNYAVTEESAEIAYTAEFGEAMTCGLTRFYAEITQRIMNEMEGETE